MTTEQYQHHAEQMEAARKEFNDYWHTVLLPQFTFESRDLQIAAQMLCWRTFKHAKGLD